MTELIENKEEIKSIIDKEIKTGDFISQTSIG